MRHLNKGRPNDTFDVFFEALEREVQTLMAADERRHNVEHASHFISVPDLIKQVKSRIPEESPIPSEATVLLSFVPKNSHNNVARLYKSRIPLRMTVQTRQLRAAHMDDHFCSAMFRYMKEYAVKYRNDVRFICMDDKSKVDFGEPSMAISSGVRGKKAIVPLNSMLSCLDHDVQSKGSLTPSVCLSVDVPENADESFYRGQVTLVLKDSVFQASTPFRHGVELQKILEQDEIKPILMLYTDGGPDHRLTYHAVKLSLIVLFKRLNLEMLIACRTAPGHSWVNPAERIMSLMNLAFQNTALSRHECNSHIEQVLKSCGSMNDIRKKAEKVNNLKEKWIESVQPIIDLLENRAKRVELKGKQFQCYTAASDDHVQAFESEVQQIDRNIVLGQYQQQNLKTANTYKQFLDQHCIEHHYLFEIRRCDDQNCCPQNPAAELRPWLPDPIKDNGNPDHYQKFDAVIGTNPTEKDRPSSQKQTLAAVAEQQQGCKNSLLTSQHVRSTVKCGECQKPRCLYAKLQLTDRESRHLNHLLQTHDYTCGSMVIPDGDLLHGKVFIRLQMDCHTHIEFPYFSSGIGRPDLCCYCCTTDIQADKVLKAQYRVVLPVCNDCLKAKETIPKRNPIKK